MKLFSLFLLVAGLGLAQNSITIRVVKNGVATEAKISGAPAAAGIEVVEKWMVTQQVCTTAPPVDGVAQQPVCTPKYASVAETGKEFILGQVERLSEQFPSSALTADIDEAKAKAAIVAAKRKALFEAARAEK
jgi:hypothetical protein